MSQVDHLYKSTAQNLSPSLKAAHVRFPFRSQTRINFAGSLIRTKSILEAQVFRFPRHYESQKMILLDLLENRFQLFLM